MKRKVQLIMTVALLFALLLAIPAAQADGLTQITVQGNGSVSTQPDMVTIHVNASALEESMLSAQQSISETVANATQALFNLGIAEADIVTTSYGYYPRYSYEQDPPKLTGYQANHALEITCRDITLLDAVITALTDSGIAEINDVSYGVTDKRGLYKQALELAVRAAEEKAAALAAASGVTLTGLESLTENQGYDARYAMVGNAMGKDAIETGIRSGSISVNASVTVVYNAQ